MPVNIQTNNYCLSPTADRNGQISFVECDYRKTPDIKYIKGKPYLKVTADGKLFLIPMIVYR